MNAKQKAEKIVKELKFDFRSFTIDRFIRSVEEFKHCRIKMRPWSMPSGMFGAWMTDSESGDEYIFYRDDVPPIHQIHIQLHELAHLLLDHSTLKITQDTVVNSITGEVILPFFQLAQLRSADISQTELEAEILASMIQEQVIHHDQLEQLMKGTSSDKNIANYLKDLGISK